MHGIPQTLGIHDAIHGTTKNKVGAQAAAQPVIQTAQTTGPDTSPAMLDCVLCAETQNDSVSSSKITIISFSVQLFSLI